MVEREYAVAAEVVPRGERLRSRGEFQAVFQGGRREERPSVLLLWKEAEGSSRVGFTVSRRVRGAVSRNRARRRLREAYRSNRCLLPARVQIIFVAREGALNRPFGDLRRDVRDGLEAITHRCRITEGR